MVPSSQGRSWRGIEGTDEADGNAPARAIRAIIGGQTERRVKAVLGQPGMCRTRIGAGVDLLEEEDLVGLHIGHVHPLMRGVVGDGRWNDAALGHCAARLGAVDVARGVHGGPSKDCERIIRHGPAKGLPGVHKHDVQLFCFLLRHAPLRQHLVGAIKDRIGKVRMGGAGIGAQKPTALVLRGNAPLQIGFPGLPNVLCKGLKNALRHAPRKLKSALLRLFEISDAAKNLALHSTCRGCHPALHNTLRNCF